MSTKIRQHKQPERVRTCREEEQGFRPELAGGDSVGGIIQMVGDHRVEVVSGVLVLGKPSANHALHHLHVFHSLRPSREEQQVMQAELLERGELHEAVRSIPTNAEPFDHKTVGWIRLHIERKSKCKEAYDVHPKSFQSVRHVDRCGRLASFADLFQKHIDLLRHGRLKVSHRLVIDGLSNEPPLCAVLASIKSIEDAGVSRRAGEQVDV